MLKNSVVVNFSNEDHRNLAMADYLQSCAEDYIKLLNVVAQAAADVDDTEVASLNDRVTAILQENNFSGDEPITFNEGYISLRELLSKVIANTDLYANYEVIPSTDIPVLTVPNIELKDFNNQVQTTKLSIQDVKDQMSNAIQSAVCSAGALYSSYKETVSDRLTYYKEYVTNTINGAKALASNSFTYFKNLLLDTGVGAQSMGKAIIDSLGIMKRAEQNDDGIINESRLVEYTGATPVPVIDFSNVVKGAITVAKTIGTVVAGVFVGLYRLVKPVFQKVVKAVSDVVNVNDVTICNETGSPSMDGWVYQASEYKKFMSVPSPSAWANYISHYGDKWIKYHFHLGEILCRVSTETDQSGANLIDFQIKPYCCNTVKVMDCFARAGFNVSRNTNTWSIQIGDTTSYEDLALALSYMGELGNELYFDPQDLTISENEYYNGFKLSSQLMHWILSNAEREMVMDGEYYVTDMTANPFTYNLFTNAPTNADFVQVVSGWNKDVNDPEFNSGPLGYLLGNDDYITSTCIADSIFTMACYQEYDRRYNPDNWVFLPYRNNVSNFNPSRYSIKTNTQNQKALDAFVNAIVAIVIAVVITVTCIVLVRKMTKKLFWKKYQAVGQIDQKIWNGQPLTEKEKRMYRRYQRKLSVSNFLTDEVSDNTKNALSDNASDNSVYTYQSMSDSFDNLNGSVGDITTDLTGLTHLISG